MISFEAYSQKNDTIIDLSDKEYFKDVSYQDEDQKNINFFTFSGGGSMPQSAFKKKVSGNLLHFNGSLLRQIYKSKPIFGGIEYGYTSIDSYNTDVEVNTNNGQEIWTSNTQSSFSSFDMIGRHYFPFGVGRFDFFGEVLLGLNCFSTCTTLIPPSDNATSEGTTNKIDLVGKYGANLGLHYKILTNYYIQARIGYQAGLSAYYYTKNQDIPAFLDSSLDAFTLQKSATDVIKWDIGVTFAF